MAVRIIREGELERLDLFWSEPAPMLVDGMENGTAAMPTGDEQRPRARRRLERRINPLHRPIPVRT